MRGARLIITYRDPSTGNGAKAVVRSRLAAVCEIQIACELQRSEKREGERAAGGEVLPRADLGLAPRVLVGTSKSGRLLIVGRRLYRWSTIQTFVTSCHSGKVVARRAICSRRSRMLPEGGREVYSFGMTAVIVTQHL
jgi:hypothetical protein